MVVRLDGKMDGAKKMTVLEVESVRDKDLKLGDNSPYKL